MDKKGDLGFALDDPMDLASLNGAFLITERVDDDLLLTLDFGSGSASLLTLGGFFARHSGPGYGADTTPNGILDDDAAVPILAALFGPQPRTAAVWMT